MKKAKIKLQQHRVVSLLRWALKMHQEIVGIGVLVLVTVLTVVFYINHSAAITAGPNNPGTLTTSAGTGNINWTNPGNASTSNDLYATASMKKNPASQNRSYYLEATNFGFTIPAGANIVGITAEVERSADTASCIRDYEVRIIKNGVIDTTQNKADAVTYWPTGDVYKAYGGSSDLWGLTWTVADINASNFGFAIMAENQAGGNPTCLAQIDHMRIRVDYAVGSTYEQAAYRWFGSMDSTDVGSPQAPQDTPTVARAPGLPFRLRALIHVGAQNLPVSGTDFKIQYAGKGAGTCASPSGTPNVYADVTSTSTIAFYNHATPSDGAALTPNFQDPTHSGHTIRYQTYEEANNFTNSQSAISAGEDGMWDFALVVGAAAPANTTYCFRMVEADGTPLDTYTAYPELTTPLVSGFVYEEQDSPPNGKNLYEGGIGFEAYTKLIGAGSVIAVDEVCIDCGEYSFANVSLVNGNTYSIIVDDNSSTSDIIPTSPSSSWAFVFPSTSGTVSFTYAGAAVINQNIGLAYIGGCTCTGGNGQFSLGTMTMDGDFTDWGPILADPDNNACDGPAGGLTDLDAPVQSTGRDLVRFTYTWNNSYYYAFTERVGSSNNIDKFIYYADTDIDGLMESGEPVVAVRWKGTNRQVQVFIGDYLPVAPGGDPLEDVGGKVDGYAMPGAIINLPPPGSPNYSGSWGGPEGLKMEWRITWADLGVPPGTPIQWHVSSTNKEPSSALLPANIDDNLGGCGGCVGSSQYGSLNFTPNNSHTLPAGDTVYGFHTIANTGNGPDVFDLISWVSASFATGTDPAVSAYYNDNGTQAGQYDAADTLLTDTDADTYIDTGSIAVSGTMDILVKIDTIAPLNFGDTAIITTAASSSVEVSCGADPPVAKTVTDSIVIGAAGGGGGANPPEPILDYGMIINSGRWCTETENVSLLLEAKNAYNVKVGNNQNLSGISWEIFTSPMTKNWTLEPGDGFKTVYAMFEGDGGIVSPVISDSIELRASGCGEPPPVSPVEPPPVVPPTPIEPTPPAPILPPSLPGAQCEIDCDKLTYDLYIVNPDGSERHMNTGYTKIENLGHGVSLIYFEDKAEDFDFNDIVIRVDKSDCRWISFKAIDFEAVWHHQIRLKLIYDGMVKKDIVLWHDSHDAVDGYKAINVYDYPEMCLEVPDGGCIIDCNKVNYEIYITNPDGVQRWMGSDYAKIEDLGNGVRFIYFEDKAEDFDYNDIVIRADNSVCDYIVFEGVSHEADWPHQINSVLYYDGVPKEDILLWHDSRDSVNDYVTVNLQAHERLCDQTHRIDIVKKVDFIEQVTEKVGEFLAEIIPSMDFLPEGVIERISAEEEEAQEFKPSATTERIIELPKKIGQYARKILTEKIEIIKSKPQIDPEELLKRKETECYNSVSRFFRLDELTEEEKEVLNQLDCFVGLRWSKIFAE